ncbi:hypothetical protein [Paenibacillus albidus]|uniref:hypothetical protein n=1 Tax=Paenibacillus albidus TaxID=2041023 RepID=UPI00166BDF77|nr:hypothetical protein [Paenibacillus albidus]
MTDEQDQSRIRRTLQTIEGFVMYQCIAMGLLQLIVLRFSGRVPVLFFRYLRTPYRQALPDFDGDSLAS